MDLCIPRATPLAWLQICVWEHASPRHFPSSSQPFSHVQAQQRLRSDPTTGCYSDQLVAHQPGHTATPCQKELCDGRPKRGKEVRNMTAAAALNYFLQNITIVKCWPPHKHTDNNLLGRAEKLEKTYRAIMSRQVSVSSRWTVFSPSSAWVTAFSSAEPRLQVVVEVCILQEETEKVRQQQEWQRRGRGRNTDSGYNFTCNQCTQRHASSDIQTQREMQNVIKTTQTHRCSCSCVYHMQRKHLYAHMHPHECI